MANEDMDNVNLTDTQDPTDNQFDGADLTLDDLGGRWLKNPKVGDSIKFTVHHIREQYNNLTPINPKNKRKMDLSLSGSGKQDGKPYNIEITTIDGSIYTVSSWEVWGKIKRLWKLAAQRAGNDKMAVTGLEFSVRHDLDGMKDENTGKDCYTVALKGLTGWTTINKKGETSNISI